MGEIIVGEYIVEWDDAKNEINKKKHKISFEFAAKVFLDDNRIDNYDEFNSDDEDRIKVIGRVGKILAVIYTEHDEKYRLISARRADKKEEEEYYGQYSYL
ncbi:MAG: BrnT family toxin [Selenomonadaceae bacterium]|nr:BrnT family toxin [Selenomonadaceae bacterium]MBQ7628842.1 BrnT family toxin [Selenomonadaceae bacterium]